LATGGYTVVYEGMIGPWFLEAFGAAARIPFLHYAILLPPESVCLERVHYRADHGFKDQEATRHMHQQFAGADIDPRYVVASTDDATTLARRPHRSQTTSNRAAGAFGNKAGGLMASQRDELLTVAQVLAALGNVSPRTFYRWREAGKAPRAVRLPNGELRIWRSDLNAWLDRLREEPAA
jgi:predicted DNA-binding transcriptional regulator AlpA